MSTLCADSQLLASHLFEQSERAGDPNGALSYSISVNADRGRVFQVLTIAEYMEAWLSVPGQMHGSPVHVTCDAQGFRIRYYDEKGMPTTLVGLYQILRTAKTMFLWSRSGDSELTASVVKIRLQGDFARTTLCLVHDGFSTDEDRRWHHMFWENSLGKLCRLFQAPAPTRTQPMNARQRRRLIEPV